MLNHLADYARQHGVAILRLETGIYQTEAISLYAADGVSAGSTVWRLQGRPA